MGELSAADVAGFHFFNGEACIKKWSPELAIALAETGAHKLRISGWDLPGFEPLVRFRDQITRIFVESDVTDVSALSQFSALHTLTLRDGADQLDFAQLKQLKSLSIAGDTPEFGNLLACRSLKILSITDCGLRDLTPLAGLADLQELEISEAPLESLEGIAGLKSLRRLVLLQLPLERLDSVKKLRGLDEVVLGFLRRLRNIGVLIELPALKTLVITSCTKVSDVEKLGEVTTLESLELDGIKLPSATFLAGLTQLRLLKLINAGKIPSLAFLQNLRALEVFMPALNTTIEDGDMSILLELPALRQVLYTERRHYKPRDHEIEAAISARRDSKYDNGGGMGSWGIGSFGNDTACDWSYGLDEVDDLSYVDSTLERVLALGSDKAVSIEDGETAIAAAEVVARLKGHWGEEDPYSETVDKWVRSHAITPPPALVSKTVAALERVLTPPSDLLAEWGEADESGAWSEAIAELKHRVQS